MICRLNPLRYFIIAVAGVICSACSPHVNHPGQQVMQPRLEREFFRAADGAILPVRSWLPEKKPFKAIIVAVHGFNDYSNSFTFPGKLTPSVRGCLLRLRPAWFRRCSRTWFVGRHRGVHKRSFQYGQRGSPASPKCAALCDG